MRRNVLNFVSGNQYGSEGKGLEAGYLARKHNVDFSICSFSSQAGHTFYDKDGKKYLVQQVPMAVVNPNTTLLISQGAIIDLDILRAEISRFNLTPERLKIHPMAVVIEQRHKDYECNMLDGPKRIASTCKGNGAAMGEFVTRNSSVTTIGELEEFVDYIDDTRMIINNMIRGGALCMAECAQGFSLDIYQGFYPYVTSRGCTPAAELARIGVAPQLVGDIYSVYRTYPIRVGNIESDDGNSTIGYSGGGFVDQRELTWEQVTQLSGASKDILERTTVTNRVRRVFEFSYEQLRLSMEVVGTTAICINFIDYINNEDFGKSKWEDLTDKSRDWVVKIGQFIEDNGFKARLALLATGPQEDHIVDMIKEGWFFMPHK